MDPDNVLPAYEDPFYFIWEESKVPVNVDPLKLDLKSALERQKLAELLNEGLDKPVGYSLPVRWDTGKLRLAELQVVL